MFLGFANFYRQFIKGFSKIIAPFNLMVKMMAPSTLARPARTRANENELGMDGGSDIGGDRIDDRMVNLSSFIKKRRNSRTSFLTPEASLAFT